VRNGSLAHLRYPVEFARGRRYPEAPHPYRNPFQRDRDRVVHSRAFRRLENKTQVFTPGLSDHFRNRLTHTIEVSQIARTVAGVLGLDEDLTEALALAHDVGHPPFGHSGEEQLDRLMKPFGEHFNHNLQSLRVVETFENSYARFPGLNLTFEVREGIVKHSRDFEPGEFPELDEYLPGLRPPLEAQLIDVCDEIAYNAADIDDAYAAGLITASDVSHATIHLEELDDLLQMQFPGASERVRMHENIRALINWMVSGLLESTLAATSGLKTVDEVRVHPSRVVLLSPEAATASRELKQFLKQRVYESEPIEAARRESTAKIAGVFALFMRDPSLMPAHYREDSQAQPLHRQVCDYIAGMTDGFFLKTCSQLGI
jgi:dGTPase